MTGPEISGAGSREVVVRPDGDALAATVAADIRTVLAAAQRERGVASVVLTGGGMGRRVLEAVRALPDASDQGALDWSHVEIWWGDERFVPAGHEDRNDVLAAQALLDHVDVDPARVHPVPPSDDPAVDGDAGAAAASYRSALALSGGTDPSPAFDVLLLGVGPDGHVASLFPEHPGLTDRRTALPVQNAPKPPPTRVSLGYRAINGARNVWCVVAGAEKASAVARGLGGAGSQEIPAAAVAGTEGTRWYLDEDAAGELPD